MFVLLSGYRYAYTFECNHGYIRISLGAVMSRMVVFVCPHGALKSRLAAALFNAGPPAGWQAASAGVVPQAAMSVHAAPPVT
jgi:hypothetical protein